MNTILRLSGVSSRTLLLLISGLLMLTPKAFGQQQTQAPVKTGDVIRVNTELVQIDVTVFDKKGHFVEGLRPEQFNLNLDGQLRTISLCERVTSGSKLEASKLGFVCGAVTSCRRPLLVAFRLHQIGEQSLVRG